MIKITHFQLDITNGEKVKIIPIKTNYGSYLHQFPATKTQLEIYWRKQKDKIRLTFTTYDRNQNQLGKRQMIAPFCMKGDHKMNIVDLIPVGKENAISRVALARKAGCSDRTMRLQIEKARRNGACILNDQDGKGYYLSRELDEIERHYRQEWQRAITILSSLKRQRAILKLCGRNVK